MKKITKFLNYYVLKQICYNCIIYVFLKIKQNLKLNVSIIILSFITKKYKNRVSYQKIYSNNLNFLHKHTLINLKFKVKHMTNGS